MGLDVGSLEGNGTLSVTGATKFLGTCFAAQAALSVTGISTFASDLKINSDYGSATQAYGVRAWLNYDHAADEINGSANVSSITDNETGKFTINWSFTWADSGYALGLTSAGSGQANGDDSCATGASAEWGTTSAATRWRRFTDNTFVDVANCNVIGVR